MPNGSPPKVAASIPLAAALREAPLRLTSFTSHLSLLIAIMSLQGLISGTECAVPFNPLSQVLKHTEGDRSLQQDRIAGPSTARLHHLPSTTSGSGSQQDLTHARQFFDESTHTSAQAQAFALAPHIPPQLAHALERSANVLPDLSSAWNQTSGKPVLYGQVPHGEQLGSRASGWSAEFGRASGMPAQGPAPGASMQRQEYSQTSRMSPAFYGGAMQSYMYPSAMGNVGIPPLVAQQGKGKGKEIDFEAAFAQATASFATEHAGSARIVEVEDSTDDLTERLQESRLEGGGDSLEYGTDFQTVWENLRNSGLPPPEEDQFKWEAQFNQLMNSEREDDMLDYGKSLQQAYDEGMSSTSNQRSIEYTDEGLPRLSSYVFEKDNRYLDPSTSSRSHLQAAKDLLEQNGSLSEVALLLEAAIQRGELGEGGYEAWILLGETRSMDEREDAAMRALTEGVKIAEAAGADGAGMLSLAVSFTNESIERGAHTMLLQWLRARYPSLDIPEAAWQSLKGAAWNSHEKVTDVFLKLAREQFSRGEMDPDVQIGLGILFYTSSEFDRAKDCFEAALAVRPRDYLLWNRMGSALSNGNKPEEALGAYREALQLRPTYTRAIYNVAVACLNIGALQEAAEHLLGALAMQDMSGGAKSDQLWHTLRRVFVQMGRQNLAEMAIPTTDVALFRKEGFDF
ncbi:uncharacterized protein FIBRA_03988 [Fibroporia radiculosa]|uniref:Uncharacterized protein n=1 Tax=Fibroporia radiculosa TaxID=599839 RepID=J4I9X4_9APHY|nr:uncharacterized protein FIBRA_03988 [Fibroporia radiculosa]CCM01916.1 predicted protein [Fibroporia radiculosa]